MYMYLERTLIKLLQNELIETFIQFYYSSLNTCRLGLWSEVNNPHAFEQFCDWIGDIRCETESFHAACIVLLY